LIGGILAAAARTDRNGADSRSLQFVYADLVSGHAGIVPQVSEHAVQRQPLTKGVIAAIRLQPWGAVLNVATVHRLSDLGVDQIGEDALPKARGKIGPVSTQAVHPILETIPYLAGASVYVAHILLPELSQAVRVRLCASE